MASSTLTPPPSPPAGGQGGQHMAGATRSTRSPAPRDDATNDGSSVGDDEILPLWPSLSLSPQRPPNALAGGSLRGVRGVSWTPDEREFLCATYVEATLNAEVGIDERLETFKEDICSRFRARLPNDMPRVERRRSRSTPAIHKELSNNIFHLLLLSVGDTVGLVVTSTGWTQSTRFECQVLRNMGAVSQESMGRPRAADSAEAQSKGPSNIA